MNGTWASAGDPGQEVLPLLGKSLMQRVPTRHVILSILKGFTFSWMFRMPG